jgi:DNA-binding HxlR family transcriptional regulator
MALLDLLSRRWALRILWELRTAEPTFRELQPRCGSISSSVLSDRLRELGEAGIVAHSGQGYTLTPAGHDLLARLLPLNEWAEHWRRRPAHSRPGRYRSSPRPVAARLRTGRDATATRQPNRAGGTFGEANDKSGPQVV